MAVTTFSVAASGDDGFFDHWDATAPTDYPPTENIETWAANEAQTFLRANKWDNGESGIQVPLLRFDTSSLADGATVTQAVLKIYVQAIDDNDNRSLNVEWYTPSAWPPVDASDFAVSVGSTAGAFDITGLTSSAVNNLTLSSPASVNLTGYTTLRLGISGGAPVGQARVDFASLDHPTDPEPQLEVTYDTAASPQQHRIQRAGLRW